MWVLEAIAVFIPTMCFAAFLISGFNLKKWLSGLAFLFSTPFAIVYFLTISAMAYDTPQRHTEYEKERKVVQLCTKAGGNNVKKENGVFVCRKIESEIIQIENI